MKLAARASRITPSPTLSLTATAKALAAQGIDVIDFASGEPDWDTPDVVKEAAIAAIRDGFTKYTASSGIEELRRAIVDKLARDHGLRYSPAEVLVSCGAKHSLYNLAEALFEAGDEVIIPSPFWVSYKDQVLLNDATPVFLETQEDEGFGVDRRALEALVTPRTKAIILNSPCNPTGATYDRATLEGIADVAVRHQVTLVWDEIYEKILYDGVAHINIATLGPEVAARTVIINGVSKAYAMTGWRIGFAAGPKPLIAAMANIQSQSTSNPTSVSQKAALAALQSGDEFPRRMVAEFDRRRRVMVERLNKMPGVSCRMPTGAFYAFPNITGVLGRRHGKGPIQSAADLSTYLLEGARVVAVPGEAFGSPRHIRLTYATRLETITRGLDRLEAALRALT